MAEWNDLGFHPAHNFATKAAPRVRKVAFGDGYEQRSPDGINTLMKEWNMVFQNRLLTDINTMTNFLEARKGTTSFTFIPVGESTTYKVVCEEWQKDTVLYDTTNTKGYGSLSVTFRQVFD